METSQKSEFVEVARDLKRYVIGRSGCVIHEIMDKSGARVSTQSKEEEGFTISGNQEQRECAKKLILQKVVSRHRKMWKFLNERLWRENLSTFLHIFILLKWNSPPLCQLLYSDYSCRKYQCAVNQIYCRDTISSVMLKIDTSHYMIWPPCMSVCLLNIIMNKWPLKCMLSVK